MATLTAFKFDTADGAQQMENLMLQLQQQGLLQVNDGAIVTWPITAKKPKTRQLTNMAGAGALGGAFWGMLFGLLFFIPFLGMAIGAGIGALTGALSDVGIDDTFINQVKAQVKPGTSALFLLTSHVVPDRVLAAIQEQGLKPQLISSNLSSEQEAKLREAFGETVPEATLQEAAAAIPAPPADELTAPPTEAPAVRVAPLSSSEPGEVF